MLVLQNFVGRAFLISAMRSRRPMRPSSVSDRSDALLDRW
jgi:hypothetical protein